MKQGIKGKNYSQEKEKYDSKFYIHKFTRKEKKNYLHKLTLKCLFYSRSVCFFSTALGHPSVDQSSRHDPESIAVFCFAALLFTSFVLILVMVVK